MNRAVFYAALRKNDSGLFPNGINQNQVNGLERLLNVWEKYYTADSIEDLSYDLATSYHETGTTMQPIKENLNYSADGLLKTFPKYFTPAQAQSYARQPVRIANRAYANRNGNGNEASGDGYRFRGEGDVQNTGRDNAARATKKLNALFNLGIDLVANPDQRGDPFISAHSLFLGNKEGWWTGLKLSDFISTGTFAEFKKSRAVVNGRDEDVKIAGYAVSFLTALRAAGPFSINAPVIPPVAPVQPVVPIPVPQPIVPPVVPAPAPVTAPSSLFASTLLSFISSLFKRTQS